MEQQQPQQPVIIQQGNKTSVGNILFLTIAGAGLLYFGNRWWKKHQANKAAEKLDTPEAQAASKIYNAHHFYNDDENIAYDAARDIANNKIPWKDVADAFLKLYDENIDSYLNFLSAEEKAKFFNILNLSSSQKGVSPPNAQVKFDTTKNQVLAFAKGAGHIRKSPKIMGTNILLRPLKSDNIVLEAKNVKPGVLLGILTGNTQMYYADNSDTGTLFYEFNGLVVGAGLKKMWIAAQFVKVDEYKTTDVAKLAIDKEAKAKNMLLIPKGLYDAADN